MNSGLNRPPLRRKSSLCKVIRVSRQCCATVEGVPLRELPTITRLDLATVTLPDWHPEAVNSPDCVVYGYAVDHPDGVVVFDTGVGTDSELIDELYDPKVQLLDRALAAAGLAPESVVAIVNSHLHFDHCGQNPLFHGNVAEGRVLEPRDAVEEHVAKRPTRANPVGDLVCRKEFAMQRALEVDEDFSVVKLTVTMALRG